MYGDNKSLTGQARIMAPDEIIVTKTDLDGKIRYGNRTFYKFADYTPAECIGQQHNIIRHPEMPRTVFKLLWDTIKSGNEIFAYVNNRSKNGDHYWVLAHVIPSRAPNEDVIRTQIQPLYADLLKTEQAKGSPKDGLDAGEAVVAGLLKEAGLTFNQWIFQMGGV